MDWVLRLWIIHIIDATPLDKERIEVTPDALKEYEKDLLKAMENIEPSFLFNLDEMGLDDRKYSKKEVVSIQKMCLLVTKYCGLMGIWLCCPEFVRMVQRQSQWSSLQECQLIMNYWSMASRMVYVAIVSSQKKLYITTDLFENYFEEILIPHINQKRKERNKPNQKH